jgi:hypothetical protein
MLLQSHPWRISYSSDTHNPVTDFYIPALECAISYDRKAGFFNILLLSAVARGLGAMLENLQEVGTGENSIRLIMGCQFSPKDLEIIHQGYELRQALETCVDRNFTPAVNRPKPAKTPPTDCSNSCSSSSIKPKRCYFSRPPRCKSTRSKSSISSACSTSKATGAPATTSAIPFGSQFQINRYLEQGQMA